MSLTRDFKETIRARVERDPKFRKELLREGIESMLAGDIATAKTILRELGMHLTQVAPRSCGCQRAEPRNSVQGPRRPRVWEAFGGRSGQR